MNDLDEKEKHWHLDKKVPVAIILTLLAQFVAAVWWAAKMDARDSEQERRIGQIERWQDGTQSQLAKMSDQLSRMDERMLNQLQALKDIKEIIGGRYARR